MIGIVTFYLLMTFACYPVIRGYWFDISTFWMYNLDDGVIDEEIIKYYIKKYSNIKEDKIMSFFFALFWPFIMISYYKDSKNYHGSLIFTNKVYR
jgi:hypothetical protein